MKTSTRVLLAVLGAVIGLPVGASIAFYTVRYGGPVLFGSDFHQISWLFMMFAVPGGALIGACLGGLTFANRPRLFLVTILPLAMIFVAQQVTLSILRREDRPRNYVLRVDGTAGAEFVGAVQADGEFHKLRGNLPAEFEFNALQVELAFALVDSKKGDKITVQVIIDETNRHGTSESHSGIHEKIKAFGYAQWAGGTSYQGGGNMSPENVAKLVKDHTMPIMWP